MRMLRKVLTIGIFIAAATLFEPPAHAQDWTGFYAGIGVGERWNKVDWDTSFLARGAVPNDGKTASQSFDSQAFRFSGYTGYNFQSGIVVVGLEADVGIARADESLGFLPGAAFPHPGFFPGDSSTVKADWDGAVLVRGGVLVGPKILVYATGGVAFLGAEVSTSCSGTGGVGNWCFVDRSESVSDTLTGWTIGGGLEAQLTANWIARGEYRFADFGSIEHTFFTSGRNGDQLDMSTDYHTNTITFGLAYKF